MFMLFHMEWVLTRVECVPNERIVDHASTGGSGLPPSPRRVPFVGELMDRVGWDGDRDLDIMLANLKKGIET